MPEAAEDHQYAGHVKCKCGCDTFELRHTGGTHEWNDETIPCTTEISGEFYLRIAAKCKECSSEHLLFDMDFHGWNGFVCREDSKTSRPRPSLVPWPCRSCGNSAYQSDVVVSGEDMESAIDESEGVLDASNWQEGFGWMDIHLHCTVCDNVHKSWVSIETM